MERYSYRFAQRSDLPILRSALSQEAWSCLTRLLGCSCTKPEWILTGFEAGAIAGVLVLASHSKGELPLEIFRLPSESDERLDTLRFFQLATEKARMLGASELYYTIPEDAPDASVLAQALFREWRKVVRFESAGPVNPRPRGYRSVEMASLERAEIATLVQKTSELSSDSQINFYRQRLGASSDAEMTLRMMESTRYDPRWWRVALDPDGNAVGVIFAVITFGEPTVGFIGVLPEFRGQGIASFLLTEAWCVMEHHGYSILCAETDQRNASMHRALTKSAFVRRWQKQEWKLEL